MRDMIVSLRQFHPIVNTLLAGTVFMIIGISMSSPFLAIYLAKNTDLSAAVIGAVIGVGPLAGAFGGFIGGMLSDLIGRKSLLILSLCLSSAVFFGYAFSSSTIFIVMFIFLGGIASSIFGTVSRALIADLSTQEQRVKVFSLQNLAFNIGWAIGPVIGVLFGLAASATPFIVTGSIYMVYAIAMGIALQFFVITKTDVQQETEKSSMKQSLQMMSRDKALFLFVIGSIIMAIAWAQFPILLSQFVTSTFDNGTEIFGLLLVINAVVIIVFQLPMSKWSEGKSPIFALVVGVLLAAAGLLGFSLSFNVVILVTAICILSLAETLVGPMYNVIIDQISPEKMKGAYFGAQNFGLLGMFLSPILGGYILDMFGGRVMYLVLSSICLLSILFFYLSYKIYLSKNKQEIYLNNSQVEKAI
ncbi:MFS transporter [Bacillus sp. 31A1R]|uniref:MFS transporter n=1 Tax=Robertmurraya mangrovi TaxID=3098077 RepID=A0ABU5IXV8_9BACI|nr:MFS transporter [Bacillus sp. 31A1R]MDZ5472009.1 MFS transporter [Bacillus sp. 31A1R]